MINASVKIYFPGEDSLLITRAIANSEDNDRYSIALKNNGSLLEINNIGKVHIEELASALNFITQKNRKGDQK